MATERFALLAIERDGRRREYFLGQTTEITGNARVIDWRRAPLASVFFAYEEGEDFEVDAGDRVISGRVVERALLSPSGAKRVIPRVRLPGRPVLRAPRTAAGLKGDEPGRSSRPAERRRAGITALVPLDAVQRGAVELPGDRSLVVLGEAGFGKTTVALHRLARLGPRAPLVIVPTANLVRLSRMLLEQLGVVRADVCTFDQWILARARRAFGDLPKRDTHDAPAAVIRLKRHAALREILPELARRFPRTRRADLLHLFGDRALLERVVAATRRSEEEEEKTFSPLSDRTRSRAREGDKPRTTREEASVRLPHHAISEALEHTKIPLTATEHGVLPARAAGEVLEHTKVQFSEMTTEHGVLPARAASEVLEHTKVQFSEMTTEHGVLPDHAIREVLEHTKIQFSETTEHEYAHVTDLERLQALDGRLIDEDTPLENAETIDAEDGAVLFELARLRGEQVRAKKYDHIVIDEAQELAPLELRAIGAALTQHGTITIAGDEHQQIDDTACFLGWDASIAELALKKPPERVILAKDYRCPPEVAAFARSLFHEGAPNIPESDGALVVSRFANACEQTATIADALRRLESEDPTATIGIICRTPELARATHANLSRALDMRLALAGDLDFRPGIIVTTASEVKGLELDVVVIPDAAATFTSATPESKRVLYVALTRALHRAWITLPRSIGREQPAKTVGEDDEQEKRVAQEEAGEKERHRRAI